MPGKYIICHDGRGASGPGEFESVVIGLVTEMGTPQVVNLNPFANAEIRFEQLLALPF